MTTTRADREASNLEIEIKLRLDSVKESLDRLARLPARLKEPSEFEDNEIFDWNDRSLSTKGSMLRLRVVGGRGFITFKELVETDLHAKVRAETETAISDPGALRSILTELGMVPIYRYQKFRSYHVWEDDRSGDELAISLDETPIGVFIELEGPKEAIDRAAGIMGFDPEDYILDDYRSLHISWAEEREEPINEMVFEDPGKHGRHER